MTSVDVNVAVIGAGNVGRALAGEAVRAGHPVVITATEPAHAAAAADAVGARAATSNAEAVREAELIVLAVPHTAVASIAAELAEVSAGKLIVDVSNPLRPDMSGLATGERSAAEELQDQLPQVADLLRAIGYRPIDAGTLSAARALEQMAFLNISLNARNGMAWRSGWKLIGPTG